MKEYTVHLFSTGGAKHTKKFAKLNFTKAMPFSTTCTMYIQTLKYSSKTESYVPIQVESCVLIQSINHSLSTKSQINISQGTSPKYITAIPAPSHITYNALQ